TLGRYLAALRFLQFLCGRLPTNTVVSLELVQRLSRAREHHDTWPGRRVRARGGQQRARGAEHGHRDPRSGRTIRHARVVRNVDAIDHVSGPSSYPLYSDCLARDPGAI